MTTRVLVVAVVVAVVVVAAGGGDDDDDVELDGLSLRIRKADAMV